MEVLAWSVFDVGVLLALLAALHEVLRTGPHGWPKILRVRDPDV